MSEKLRLNFFLDRGFYAKYRSEEGDIISRNRKALTIFKQTSFWKVSAESTSPSYVSSQNRIDAQQEQNVSGPC